MTDEEMDAMRTAVMALKHNLFGDERDADQVCQLFTSWEQRAKGFETTCGALLRIIHNNGGDAESVLDWIALHAAGE